MQIVKYKNIKSYDKLMCEIDNLLAKKRVSYAQLAIEVGIPPVTFYNKYRVYGFQVDDMVMFLESAKQLQPKMIKCMKCSTLFLPNVKSVRRAFCSDCKEKMKKKSKANDNLKFTYPEWVEKIFDKGLKKLVEQEFHIDTDVAFEMSRARGVTEAKQIRSTHWKVNLRYYQA